jgi:hypothetical protein
MPSSSYNCVKKSDVAKLGKAVSQYKRISDSKTVRKQASKAGQPLLEQMQGLIRGEPSLSDFGHIADAMRVFSHDDNVSVGLPADHPLLPSAQQMHNVFQVSDVAFDLAQQSGEVEGAFHDNLGLRSQPWWRRMVEQMR